MNKKTKKSEFYVKDDENRLILSSYIKEKDRKNTRVKKAAVKELLEKGRGFLRAWQVPEEAVASFGIWEDEGERWLRCPNDPLLECRLVIYPKKYIYELA